MQDGFFDTGFLSEQIRELTVSIRAENDSWFKFAEAVNAALMRIVKTAMDDPVAHGGNWSKEALSVRLLMRSSGSFQGVILMAERGMVVQARTLIRSTLEDSFVAAALTTQPDKIIQMLKNAEQASRRFQGQFIITEGLGPKDLDKTKLKEAVEKIDNEARFLNFKKVAALGPLLPQYLNYARLSLDSAHTSAVSLQKHIIVSDNRKGWSYRLGPAIQDDIVSTLHQAVISVLSVGIVVNQFMPDENNNSTLVELAERVLTLPKGSTI